RLGNLRFQRPIEPATLQPLALARDRDFFQAQIDADPLLRGYGRLSLVFHGQTHPPVPDGILREAALLPLHPLQALRFEHSEGLPAEPQGAPLTLRARLLKRNPPEGASFPPTDPPTQLATSGCRSLLSVLHAHPLNRV